MPRFTGRPAAFESIVLRLAAVFTILFAIGVGDARAADENEKPSAVVAALQESLLSAMKDADKLGFDGRYERLQPALDQAFDIEQMTRIVVGGRWSKLSAAEQAQIVEQFRRFSVSTYANEFSGYDGERFAITGERDQPGIGTIVETQIQTKAAGTFALNYVLHQTPAGWQIIDVHLDGSISELARRRDEFASIIRRDGVAGLIVALKKKTEELARS